MELEMPETDGDRFFRETRYSRVNVQAMRSAGSTGRPEPYKEYPNCPRIALPPPVMETLSLDRVLKLRKSVRRYAARPLSAEQVSYLLWAVAGIQRTENGFHFRPAPSAGALYPIETYLAVNNVAGIPKGIYHYAIRPHALEEIRAGDVSAELVRATMGQRMHADAPVAFIWTAIFQRSRFRYHDRAYRYILLDAGHIAQNLALAAVGLGLASCQVGAFFDDEVDALIGVNGADEGVVYMSVAGWPA
jgi:SagB-type dehydrogenase family enzyme